LLTAGASILSAALGAPGRATGGPVSPGRPFLVGERGPELFVPTSSGSVATLGTQSPRDVRVSISVNAPAGTAPETLARSSRQVARAVRAALLE
jgi:phage-related minor tail protein